MLQSFGTADAEGNVKAKTKGLKDFTFLNVDLELESKQSLEPLLDELGEKVCAMFPNGEIGDGKQFALGIGDVTRKRKWIYHSFNDKNDLIGGADILISAFCDLIENLSPKSRRIWDKCRRKEFDVGFECGNTMKTYRTLITAETAKRCGDIGASISVTVYPIN